MKKLFLGVIATVMFGSLGFGKDFVQNRIVDLKTNTSVKVIEDEIDGKWCGTFYLEINYDGISGGISSNFCCYLHEAHSTWIGCNWAKNVPHYLYIDLLDAGNNELAMLIKNKKLKTIKIIKSNDFEIEGVKYTSQVGDYSIESDEKGSYVKILVL